MLPLRRSAMRHRLPLRLCTASLCLLWAAGCADLRVLDKDVCGNGVVEEDEDCDGEESCGKAGTAHACRFTCSTALAQGCPEGRGFGCGVDGVCRAPRGGAGDLVPELAVLDARTTLTVLDVFTGDLNADGCSELITTTRRGMGIAAFASQEPGLCPAFNQDLPGRQRPPDPGVLNIRPSPFLVDLTNDGRPDLLRARDAAFDTGLFVYAPSDQPAVSPLLQPTYRMKQSGGRPLRVRKDGRDRLLLLVEETPGAPAVPALFEAPDQKPRLFMAPSVKLDSLVLLGAADLWGKPDGTPDNCDEVVMGIRGEGNEKDRLSVFSLCGPGMSLGPVVSVELDSGARLRDRAASLAIVDADMDQILDIVVNASDKNLHVAYGTGKSGFRSVTDPNAPPSSTTGVLTLPDPMLQMQLTNQNVAFVAGGFNGSAEPAFVPLPCPPSDKFTTPACAFIAGSCEAAVDDLDGDGLLDIVSSDEQQPGLTVRRGGGAPFHETFLDTQCPPHFLATGDFDDDGVKDIAFFDQRVTLTTKGEVNKPVATLNVAYGKPLAAPEPAVESGIYEDPVGLSSARFLDSLPADQLLAVRQLPEAELARVGVALVGGEGDRLLSAPFYIPDGSMQSNSGFVRVEVDAAAPGRFGNTEPADSPFGVVAVMRDPEDSGGDAARALHRFEPHSSGTGIKDLGKTKLECNNCVLLAMPLDGAGDAVDEVVVFNEKHAYIYTVTAEDFELRRDFATTQLYDSVNASKKPEAYVPRPLVTDIDGDGYLDIALSAADGSVAVFWGKGGGQFDEEELVPAPQCGSGAPCARNAITLLNVDDDDAREIVVIGPEKLEIHDALSPGQHKLGPSLTFAGAEKVLPQLEGTDFVSAYAADFDGDGVGDLALVPNSSIRIILRGVPRLK